MQNGPKVNLSWTDNATNEIGYNVEEIHQRWWLHSHRYGSGSQQYWCCDLPGLDGSSGNTDAYRVNAYINPTTVSIYSNTASVIVPAAPAAPGNFVAAIGPNGKGNSHSVILTWLDLSNNETGFTIQRATNAAFTANLNSVSVAAGVQAFTQTGLSRNTTYYYRIRAINGPLVSSAWVLATPFPITTR